MTKTEIRELFPCKATITQEIINGADLMDTRGCIGALTLKSILPEELHDKFSWGVDTGTVSFDIEAGNSFCVTTEEGVDMMEVREPMEVTFRIIN